jgi:mRNA interferase MazF
MGMVIKQYEVYFINLDPTAGYEVKKTRPCLIISPGELNAHLKTVIIAPMTTKSHAYPTRVSLQFKGKDAYICLDQIRTVDQRRLQKKMGSIPTAAIVKVKTVIREMLVD